MSSIDIRPIEQAKIDCAKVLFNKVNTSDIQYEVVKDYKELLNIVSQ
jgi:type III restriction enzyme